MVMGESDERAFPGPSEILDQPPLTSDFRQPA